MKSLIISSLSIFLCFFAQAQYCVMPITKVPLKEMENGFYYSLPQTGIKVEIRLTKTIFHKGIYSNYAATLLGLSDVISEDRSSYEISDIQIQNFAIPDPSEIYFVSTKKTNLQVQWNDNGTLLSINYAPIHKQNENPILLSQQASSSNLDTPQAGNIFTELNVYEKFDTIFKKIKVDTMLMVQKVIKSDMVKKTEAQKAEEMANQIIATKNKREDLLSGMQEVNYDAKTMAYMTEELLASASNYLLCFTGYSERSSYTYTFEFIPEQDTLYPIAYFSNQTGITPLEKEEAADAQTLYLIFNKEDKTNKQIQKFNKKALLADQPIGFYYRLPSLAQTNVYLDQHLLKQEQFPIAQWGNSLNLPATDLKLSLDPLTGAIHFLEFTPTKK
ncbi:MAG: DUF4831 family protein [Bacteroidales bacterium]